MKKLFFIVTLFFYCFIVSANTINTAIDGCSGTASFTMVYDAANCCWTFQNTTTNDCNEWVCLWDFGDGSPALLTPQGVGTACHQYPIPGTYNVTLQFISSACHGGSGNTCTGQQEVTIPELDLDWTVSIYNSSNSTNVSCEGESDGWIQLDTTSGNTYVWPEATNPFDSTLTGSYIDSLGAGSYNVVATAPNGCQGSQTFQLFEPTLSGSGQLFEPSCKGFSDGSIDFTPSGGLPPYSYIWSDNSTNQDILNIGAGIYEVSVVDSFNCPRVFQFNLGEPDTIQNSFSSSFYNGYNVSCYNASDGFIEINPIGGTPPYQYSWSNGASSQDLNNIPSGAFFLTLTDNNDCVFYDNFYLNQPTEIYSFINSTTDYNGFDISCYNYNDGGLEIFTSGSIPPYTYDWSNGGNQANLSNLSAGLHEVEVIDFNGCTHTNSIVLLEPNLLEATSISENNYNGYDISCFNFSDGAIDLTMNGGVAPYLYAWNNGMGIEDLDNLSEGTYSVNALDQNNCSATTTITLVEPPPFVLSYSLSDYNGYNVSCNSSTDGWMDINVDGGLPPYSFLWNNGATSEDLNLIPSSNYVVNIQDANQCQTTLSAELNEPSPLVSNIMSETDFNNYDIRCYGLDDGSITATISGSLPPYDILWSNDPSQNALSQSNLYAGQYLVQFTDLNGCVKTDSIELFQPQELSSTVSSFFDYNGYEISCYEADDGQIDLTVFGGVQPYQYLWNNGYSDEDPNSLTSGYYSVSFNDLNNCINQNDITLNEPNPFTTSLTQSDYNGYNISCYNGMDGWIDISVSGSVPPYTYIWSNNDATEDINGLTANSYSVEIKDLNLCSSFLSVNLSQPSELIPEITSLTNFSGYDISCNGFNDGSVFTSYSGSVPPYSILWNNGLTSDTITDLTASLNSVIITDLNNCQATDSIMLTEPPVLASTTSSVYDYNGYEISCFNYSNGAVDLDIDGGVSPYSILWNNNETIEDLNNLTAGIYSVSITDNNDCINTNQITLNQPTPLSLSFGLSNYNGFNISCYGFEDGFINTLVSGSVPPYSYEWNTGVNTQNLFLLSSGNYDVQISDLNNCVIYDEIELTEPNNFFINLSNSKDTCNRGVGQGIVYITPEANPYEILWSNGETDYEINNLFIGDNSVTVTDMYGCEKSIDFFTGNLPSPIANFYIEPQNDSLFYQVNSNLNFFDESIDSWSIINSWDWDFGDGNSDNTMNTSHAYNSIGYYNVLLRINNIHGCMDTVSKILEMSDFIIHFPNAFTPQGDLINERFSARGINIKELHMTIYSRWGEQIFITTDINEGWDGTYQSTGKKCPQGVYVYDVHITDAFGDLHRFTGDVTLID